MKKLSALLLCLLMIVTCALAGCATFSIDKVKYYNEVVATVGEEKITRYDLLNAYSSYGQNYYQSQLGQSEQDAFKSTFELLIKRESLYQWAKENITLTAYEVNSAVESMFDSLDSQMENYVATAKTIFNISATVSPAEEKTETAYKLSDYYFAPSRRATVNAEDSKKIDYLVEEKTYTPVIAEEFLEGDLFKAGTIEEVKTKYLAHFQNTLVNETQKANLYNKAIALLADDLINYEYYLRDAENKPYNTVTNDLLFRYFERNYTSQIKGAYLTKIRSNYLRDAATNGTLSTDKIVSEYKDLYTESYEKYVNNKEQYKTDMAAISTGADSVLYHPDFTDGTRFGYFVHALISFDEAGTQKAALDAAKTSYENSSSPDKETTYNAEVNAILSTITSTERDLETGLLIKDTDGNNVKHSIDYVLEEYAKVHTLTDFIKFMFRFSTDNATLSAGMPYVLGYDATYDGETIESKKYVGSYSDMVKEFTKEGINLMQNGKTMSEKLLEVDSSKMCVTTYGIHFLYYVGEISSINDPDPDAAYCSKNVVGTNNLCSILNPLTGETYFDKLFNSVYPTDSNEEVYASVDSYDTYEESLIDNSKITIYDTKLNGTKS
ncbi:MAG: SurA N-terminal domain-containing protein, partial [Clostridia bacterium]|nr:SurA N-terminal domain-containing protein [Clostridia bacterium]